jgi:hypothetical protein
LREKNGFTQGRKDRKEYQTYMFHQSVRVLTTLIIFISCVSPSIAQSIPASYSGKRLKRIVIRGAMIVDGSGKPAAGPYDIVSLLKTT